MEFFHISHTDLDGYGCQLISKKIFNNGFFINANYGLEVKQSLEVVISKILSCKNKDIFFLISDLNLTIDEANKLDDTINRLNNEGYNIKLQLLDHHGTGQRCFQKYDWYYLDISRSATKIVYDYFKDNYNLETNEKFDKLIEAINAVDIWLEDSEYFEFGKVCMSMIARANEVNNTIFSDNNRDFRLTLLENAMEYVDCEGSHIALDEKIYTLKKEYLKLDGKDDTMDNLSSKYLVNMLGDRKEELTVTYKEHKGLMTFGLGNISIPANTFLKANSDYDFFVDLGRRGKASFRADGKLDVAKLAGTIARGGGHKNAAGASFDDWEETISYEEAKRFLQNKLSSH
jgi:oligoribonuclease NrnB/cAMP/cGMP phosphodiesterase (DHH superfamily)